MSADANDIVPGYNPLWWKGVECEKRGCFNVKKRPKIEEFAECFPGGINFGDADGLVEINGFVCLLEWKSPGEDIPAGQRILHERLTMQSCLGRRGNLVVVICGDAEFMTTTKYKKIWRGKDFGWVDCPSLEDVKAVFRDWTKWCHKQSDCKSLYKYVTDWLST